MKAVILAGGFGTRLAEETDIRPKPMVEIGGKPIIWHIMSHYAKHEVKEFVICLGYKSEYIKKFFLDTAATLSDFTIDLSNQHLQVHNSSTQDWKVTLIDTGLNTMTGGRIKRALKYMEPKMPFCLTYGDGLSDINISKSIEFHLSHDKICTVTAVSPPGRFGVMDVDTKQNVHGFREKIISDQHKINGGFFVINPEVGSYIEDDQTVWEEQPLRRLALDRQLKAWNHEGFWHPIDTLRDKRHLEDLWNRGQAPWNS